MSANYGGMALNSWNTGGNAPLLDFNCSRSATIGTHTIVQSGDLLGVLTGRGSNGAGGAFKDAAQIQFVVDGTPGTGTDMPGRIGLFTSLDGSATAAERVRVDNAGLVTIDVDGTMNAGTHHFQINNGGSTSYIDAGSLTFTSSDVHLKDHIEEIDTAAVFAAYEAMPAPRKWQFKQETFKRPQDLAVICADSAKTKVDSLFAISTHLNKDVIRDSLRAKVDERLASLEAMAIASAAVVHVGPMAQDLYPVSLALHPGQGDSTIYSEADHLMAMDLMIRRQQRQIADLTEKLNTLSKQ